MNWSNFRVWAAKNWGVPVSSRYSDLGDDLWMLEYSSEAEVRRVLALGRTLYEASKVFLDRWTSEAGRTDVLKKQGGGLDPSQWNFSSLTIG
ncbi:hypothetical protein LINPERPRIM_LOCUS6881 [Linum perenne]